MVKATRKITGNNRCWEIKVEKDLCSSRINETTGIYHVSREIVFKLLTCSHISFFVLGGGCPGAKLSTRSCCCPGTVMQLYLCPLTGNPSPALPRHSSAGAQQCPGRRAGQPQAGLRLCQVCPQGGQLGQGWAQHAWLCTGGL